MNFKVRHGWCEFLESGARCYVPSYQDSPYRLVSPGSSVRRHSPTRQLGSYGASTCTSTPLGSLTFRYLWFSSPTARTLCYFQEMRQ